MASIDPNYAPITCRIPPAVLSGLWTILQEKAFRPVAPVAQSHALQRITGDLPETKNDRARQSFLAFSLFGSSCQDDSR
jgi:hypothetical protein